MVDNKGVAYYPRVGSHESVDIGPYLKHFCIKRSSKNGSRIVGTASAEIGDISGIITCYESRNNDHIVLQVIKYAVNKTLCRVIVEHVLVPLLFGLYEVAAVKVYRSVDNLRYYDRRQSFAIAHDYIKRAIAQILNQAYSAIDVAKLLKQRIDH